MKLIFYRYGSICEPDIIETMQALGISVSQVTLEILDKATTPQKTIQAVSDLLSKETFDCVFSINYYPVLSAICNIFKVRYISWTVDSPVMELYSNTIKNEWNRTFIFDHADFETFGPKNPGRIFYMPLGVNTDRLKRYLDNQPLQRRLAGEISFVGSLYSEKSPIVRYTQKDSFLAGYLESAAQAQSRLYGCFMLEEILLPAYIEEFKANLPGYYTPPEEYEVDEAATIAMLYLGPRATVIERERLLTLLGRRFDVKLFTASDASDIPVRSCGTVKSMEEMPLVFRDSRINLNFTTKTIRTGIPQRIFDILGCGGFLLTNYQAEIPALFDMGAELSVFTDDNEMLEMAEYYLSHENERKDMAAAGYEAAVTKHDLKLRLADIFEMAFGV